MLVLGLIFPAYNKAMKFKWLKCTQTLLLHLHYFDLKLLREKKKKEQVSLSFFYFGVFLLQLIDNICISDVSQ